MAPRPDFAAGTAAVVRLLQRLRAGGRFSEVLREVAQLAVEAAPGSHVFCAVREGGEPLLMVAWPGPQLAEDAPLWDGRPSGTERVAAGHALAAEAGRRGLKVAERERFEVREGLEGVLVVLAPAAPEAGSTASWASLAASLLASWDAERRLKELSERHRLVTQASQLVIKDWDVATGAVGWSNRMEDVFGHALAPEMEEVSWWKEQLHPDDRERVWSSLQRAMAERELYWTCEYRFQRGDGGWAWVFDRGSLVYDGTARAARLLGVMEDISRDRELESRLTLASRLAAVGSLASGISHEINNPLAWVTSNLSFCLEEVRRLARDQADPERCEELTEALDDAQTGANRIAQIVNDLRTFAHADTEKVSPVSVRRVVESALTMVNNEVKHRARLVRVLDPVPMVLANEARLGQAVVNLLLNAAWSAGSPGVTPEMTVATRTDSSGRAVLEVTDNGAALAAEVLPHVFDPFYAARRGGEGIGLGLAVSRSIVHGLGGTIEVESAPGKGTTFRVLLPPVPEEEAGPPAPTPPPPARRVRVVVVDDERAILTAIERMLGPSFEVRSFEEGQPALESIARDPPDAILCDVMMPEMSGAELWRRLEAGMPDLLARVVFLTGGAFTPEAQAFVETLKGPVVEKPFSMKALKDAVRSVLG